MVVTDLSASVMTQMHFSPTGYELKTRQPCSRESSFSRRSKAQRSPQSPVA
jgi:hypothetical protein